MDTMLREKLNEDVARIRGCQWGQQLTDIWPEKQSLADNWPKNQQLTEK